ncbi:MAG: flavodoxin domain-containing protein [Candidatus Omnitrophica bacterium]|nr:flavodoxin domain-containing protein [Candidatus Omnitrophota bacterium]
MPKALIVYYSRSGNTKAIAEDIAAAVTQEGLAVDLRSVEKVQPAELSNYQLIICGGPTYYGGAPYQIKQLLDETVKFHGQLDGKVGGAFCSSANIAGGNETTLFSILNAFLIHGMIIQGDPRGDHYGPVAINAPDDRCRSGCRRYGQRLARLTKQLFGD